MVILPSAAQRPAFPDVAFHPSMFGPSETVPGPSGKDDTQTIDFGASQAYFSGLESTRSATHAGSPSPSQGPSPDAHRQGRDRSPMSPNSAISGLDPVSKLGFTSNRPFTRQSPNSTGSPQQSNCSVSPSALSSQPPHASQSPDRLIRSELETSTSTQQQRKEDAAHRTAEVERRNKLREEEKARRSLAIQKQVDDGMAALRLEKDEAAQRSAEVERRNKVREEEKEKRRLAIQKQVEDGIKAIKLKKQRERARVEADRDAFRQWLSYLHPSNAASSSAAVDTTIDVYAALGCQLRGFWEASRPAASSQAQRSEVIADVQRALTKKWPGQGLQVAAFGSSVTGLVTESSDLDLVLLDPTRPYGVGTPPELRREPNDFVRHTGGMPEWYSTNQIANAIRNSSKFRSVVSINGASVPIVKMVHKKYNIPADININERFGLFNSQLISAYANLQPDLVRPLIFFLKHWFSKRELNDPAGKRGSMTFSNYTIALMALQVLQVEGVLPNLQNYELLNNLNIRPNFLYSRIRRPRRGGTNGRQDPIEEASTPQKYNVTFASTQVDAEPYRRKALELSRCDHAQTSSVDRLLGRMLAAFMRFYKELDRHAQIVSVVNGSPLQRRTKPRHVLFDSASETDGSEFNEDRNGPLTQHDGIASRDPDARAALREETDDPFAGDELVVQDPFIIDRNTSRNIKSKSIERWQDEMGSAIHTLGLHNAGEFTKVRLQDAPLILDLCIPQNVLSDMEADVYNNRSSASAGTEVEPGKSEEDAAAQARDIAKEAAQILRKERKKRARRSRRREARVLQEEAAMVEDMIDGIDTGRVTGLMSGDGRHEIWRLRVDSNETSNEGRRVEDTPIPFTFSVARSPGTAAAQNMPQNKAAEQGVNGGATLDPTMSLGTNRIHAFSSSSRDIDSMALRLEQNARVADV